MITKLLLAIVAIALIEFLRQKRVSISSTLPEKLQLLCSENDIFHTRLLEFLDDQYTKSRPPNMSHIEPQRSTGNDTNVLNYINDNNTSIGIFNEFDYFTHIGKYPNVQFLAAPYILSVFFLIQYYQDVENGEDTQDVENGEVENDDEDNAQNNDIKHLNLKHFTSYIKKYENRNDGPFILAVGEKYTIDYKIFSIIQKSYKFKFETLDSLDSLNDANMENKFYIYHTTLDNAVKEFQNERIDGICFLIHDRDWRIKEIFDSYHNRTQRSPIVLNIEDNYIIKNQYPYFLKKTINTKQYYSVHSSQKQSEDDNNEKDKSDIDLLSEQIQTIGVRTCIGCNKNIDEDIIHIFTDILVDDLIGLLLYVYPGCEKGDTQNNNILEFYKYHKMKTQLEIEYREKQEERNYRDYNDKKKNREYNKQIGDLQHKLFEMKDAINKLKDEYVKIEKKCDDAIKLSIEDVFETIFFSFPQMELHPGTIPRLKSIGFINDNDLYKYDLNYYVDEAKKHYWTADLN